MNENTENINEMELIAKVQLSGSLISKNRETLAFQTDVKESNTGFIFAPSKKEIYNIDELKKTRDLEVIELIPTTPETELDLVPRPIYEDALDALAIAEETIEIQTLTIANLEERVLVLETENEQLKEEVDNEKLLRVLAEDNFDSARQEVLIISQDTQLTYQRSILDGIEKTSLEARNEGLIAQNEALRDELAAKQAELDQLEKSLQGKEAQIEAGAKSNSEITVRIVQKLEKDSEDLKIDSIRYDSNSDPFGDGKWINGPDIELYNFTAEPQTIKFVQDIPHKYFLPIPDLTLQPNEKKTIKVKTDSDQILALKPIKRRNSGSPYKYRGKIMVKSKTGEIVLTTYLYKHVSR